MPENFTRARRVGDQIRRDLAELISREVADPRVRGALVSDVEVSRDLAHANVYIICPADNDSAACLEGLGRANGFLRRRLAKLASGLLAESSAEPLAPDADGNAAPLAQGVENGCDVPLAPRANRRSKFAVAFSTTPFLKRRHASSSIGDAMQH